MIIDTETTLGVMFTEEYREYILVFGVASANGHELTGLCRSPRLNVVEVTMAERKNNANVPNDWYVVEQANIDDIVIWQASSGEIYQTAPGVQSCKLCDSLSEYVAGMF